MPRIVGLGLMIGGNLAVSYGLGANGLSDNLPFKVGTIRLLDMPETEVTLADAPEALIAIGPDDTEAEIELGDEPETTIELGPDDPETTIEMADDKDC